MLLLLRICTTLRTARFLLLILSYDLHNLRVFVFRYSTLESKECNAPAGFWFEVIPS